MSTSSPVALVTGGAQRIGAEIVRALHKRGYNVWLHFHTSHERAQELAQECNAQRPDSVYPLNANLSDTQGISDMVSKIQARTKRLDLLVNNASSFYETPWGKINEQDWNKLMDSNIKGSFFLTQALTPLLKEALGHGNVVNLSDHLPIYNLQRYPLYSIAKGALNTATRSLALCLAPKIRVNALALGVIMPQQETTVMSEKTSKEILLPDKYGSAKNIAEIVCFLASAQASYITGQLIPVDGGRRLHAGSI